MKPDILGTQYFIPPQVPVNIQFHALYTTRGWFRTFGRLTTKLQLPRLTALGICLCPHTLAKTRHERAVPKTSSAEAVCDARLSTGAQGE